MASQRSVCLSIQPLNSTFIQGEFKVIKQSFHSAQRKTTRIRESAQLNSGQSSSGDFGAFTVLVRALRFGFKKLHPK